MSWKRLIGIESEKEGHNITFEKAANEWFDKFAKAWTEHYLPNARFIKNGKKDKNI